MNKLLGTVLSGFLGAGKTTFLSHWIRASPDERIMADAAVGNTNPLYFVYWVFDQSNWMDLDRREQFLVSKISWVRQF